MFFILHRALGTNSIFEEIWPKPQQQAQGEVIHAALPKDHTTVASDRGYRLEL